MAEDASVTIEVHVRKDCLVCKGLILENEDIVLIDVVDDCGCVPGCIGTVHFYHESHLN